MARAVALRHAADVPADWSPVRPPGGDPPARWEIADDGSDAIWWQWLDVPSGTRPAELTACWYEMDDLGMGIALFLPRRIGGRAVAIDSEARDVVRLVDLEGWTRRKTGKRLYRDLDHPKQAARSRLTRGRSQLAAAGVLPWAAWPSGNLPDSWWDDPETLVAMTAWRASALLLRDDLRSWGRRAQGAIDVATGLTAAALRAGPIPRLRGLARLG